MAKGAAPPAFAGRSARSELDRPARVAGREARRGEVALVTVGMLAVACFRVWVAGGPGFGHDSYQYLSVADNVRQHGTIATSVISFDVERSHGEIPAPSTTFPAGYSLVIAALSLTGVRLDLVALLVSMISGAAVIPLLYRAGAAMGLGRTETRAVAAGWALNAQAALFATAALSEALFTAVSLAAVVLLLERRTVDPSSAARRTVAAGLLVGLAYHVRYAGLFFAAAFHAWAIGELIRARRRRPVLLAVALCDALIAVGIVRNVVLAGTWQGGNTKAVIRPLASLVRPLFLAGSDLLVGASGWLRPPLSVPASLFAIATVASALALVAIVAWSCVARRPRFPGAVEGWSIAALWGGVYLACIGGTAVSTVISFGARMLVPVLPLALLAIGGVVTAWRRHASRPAISAAVPFLAVFAVSYASVNLATLRHQPVLAPHLAIASALDAPMPDGLPLARWVETAVPRDAVVVSVNGQATGYVLGRKTVSTIGPAYSDIVWTEDATRSVMSRFGATYLIVYPEALLESDRRPADPFAFVTGLYAPFLRDLAWGRTPEWLELAAGNGRALVFRRRHE